MKKVLIFCAVCFLLGGTVLADVNVLVVGSSQSFDSVEKAFSAQLVADELRSILEGDASVGIVNVIFDDIYTTKTIDTSVGQSAAVWSETYRRYSLAQYYFWPDGRDARLNNLKSAAGTTWDYVVLMDDSYLMARMPGVHAEGVKLMADAALSGGAQVLLMMQWPGPSTASSVGHYGQVGYRVGDNAGISVIPAGYAWDGLPEKDKDTSTQHPTPNGAYLAAAAIYAEIYNQSAGTGSTYNVNDGIADHALTEVQTRKLSPQYSGNFIFANPFTIRGIKKRRYTGWDRGTSSEDGIKGAYRGSNFLPYTGTANGWTSPNSTETVPVYPAAVYDFDLGRGNSWFEDWKSYIVDTNYFSCSFGFPMQDHRNTGNLTMRYGIDKRYYNGVSFDDGTDFGIGYKIIANNELAGYGRCIPIRLLWSKMFEDNPTWTAYADSWHMHGRLNTASASFLYTILTGRCAVGTTGAADYLYARRLGYETAWRMSTLQLRAPGFEVLPTSSTSTNVTPTNSQTLSVRFISAPTSDVAVAVSTDDPYIGKASPSVLTFTPLNYQDVQTVTVWGETGPAGSYGFDVVLTTSSTDPAYDGVSDSWDFYNTRLTGPVPSDIRVLGNGFTIISGDMEPELATGTDFGITTGSVVQVFTITNQSGSATVDLTGGNPLVNLTAPGGHFILSQDASNGSLGPNSSTSFEITYMPQSVGLHTALVAVASSDVAVPLYTFGVTGIRPGVPTVSTHGAVSEDTTSATLSGKLSGGGAADTWFCWGETDAGTGSTGDWDNVVAIGSVIESETFSTLISGLDTNASYWFRCYAGNAAGTGWSDNAMSFSGTAVSGSGGDPISGAYYEWDAAQDTDENNQWPSTTANSYAWTIEGGSLPPVDVSDSRFDTLSKAYVFPAARSQNQTSLETYLNENADATWELVFDTDSNDGLILESGGTTDGFQFWIQGGVLKGQVRDGGVNATVSYTLTSADTNRFIHVVYVIDMANDKFKLYVDGVEVNYVGWTGSDWCGNNEAGLGRVGVTAPAGSVADFNGKLAFIRYYSGKAFTAEEVTTNLDALSSGSPVANLVPTAVTASQAALNATLFAENTNYTVFVYWGPSDGGANPSMWLNTALVGAWTNVAETNISHEVSGLEPGQRYCYTFMATDSVTNMWATPSWRFLTAGSAVARTETLSHVIPHVWLAGITPEWTNDYEAAAMSDPDGDGFTTWQEYWSGTDPTNSESFFKIDAITFDGGNIRLDWEHANVDPGIPALTIQSSSNLVPGSWKFVTQHLPVEGSNSWIHASSEQLMFYRIVVTNTP